MKSVFVATGFRIDQCRYTQSLDMPKGVAAPLARIRLLPNGKLKSRSEKFQVPDVRVPSLWSHHSSSWNLGLKVPEFRNIERVGYAPRDKAAAGTSNK